MEDEELKEPTPNPETEPAPEPDPAPAPEPPAPPAEPKLVILGGDNPKAKTPTAAPTIEDLLKASPRPPVEAGQATPPPPPATPPAGQQGATVPPPAGGQGQPKAKKGKTKIPNPDATAKGIINTIEMVSMVIASAIAGDLDDQGKYAFDPKQKQATIDCWADWLETLELEMDILWLPAVAGLLMLVGGSVVKGVGEKKRKKEKAQGNAAKAQGKPSEATTQPRPGSFEVVSSQDTAAADTEKEPDFSLVTLHPGDFTRDEQTRKRFAYDKITGLYTHDGTTLLKAKDRKEKISWKIKELVDQGANASVIQRIIRAAIVSPPPK